MGNKSKSIELYTKKRMKKSKFLHSFFYAFYIPIQDNLLIQHDKVSWDDQDHNDIFLQSNKKRYF
jgi:hypothetical protein